MPSRYRCMRKFPGYQAALLNQNSKDIPTPSDRTCYFFGIPMEIKPVTLHAKTWNKLAVYQVFLRGQRVLHQECCRSHHVISAWNLIMHRIPDLYNFILNSSEAPTLHSSKPTTSSSSSRPSSPDSPSTQSSVNFPNSVPPSPNVPLHAKASTPVVVTSVCTVILVMAVIGIVFLLVLRKRRRCYQGWSVRGYREQLKELETTVSLRT